MSEHQVPEPSRRGFTPSPFGRVRESTIELFKRAGFCEQDAKAGARLLESGRYQGFSDVATSMGVFNAYEFRRRNPGVTPARIAEVAKELQGDTSKSVAEGGSKDGSEVPQG